MTFLADMGISQSTVKWLRQQGYDTVHVRDLNMHRSSDDEIIEKARTDKRTVLTCNLDFGDIMAVSKTKAPSIVLFRLEDSSPSHINARLAQVLVDSYIALTEGAIVIVEETRHRVKTAADLVKR
jgi:predicted nuclease of predicted toxin-antitoxin system